MRLAASSLMRRLPSGAKRKMVRWRESVICSVPSSPARMIRAPAAIASKSVTIRSAGEVGWLERSEYGIINRRPPSRLDPDHGGISPLANSICQVSSNGLMMIVQSGASSPEGNIPAAGELGLATKIVHLSNVGPRAMISSSVAGSHL